MLELAVAGVHDPAGVGPVAVVAQGVVVELLPGLAAEATQLVTSVGPVVTVSQVMPPPAVQLPTGTGVQISVCASQERSCDVLCRTWVVLNVSCDVLTICCAVETVICAVLRVVCAVLCVTCDVLCRF